jgi:hypothetical protein
VLAYVFWHRPLEDSAIAAYEQAQLAFHRSLDRTPPAGFVGSACYRAATLPWLHGAAGGYEDWYFVEDYTALGVLNEAAIGHGHRTPHDALARRFGGGAGGLYGLVEGDRSQLGRPPDRTPIGEALLAVWVARTPGIERRPLGELLGDGMDPRHASLWRRQLVFGPAPEFCLLAPEPSAGVAPTRLPQGWTATTLEREALWHS